MTRVFKGGALVVLIAILMTPAIYADDPPVPVDPQGRLGPPIGAPTEEEPPSVFELFWDWLQASISPPNG